MNKLLTLGFLIINLMSFSQTWHSKSGSSDFDGGYKSAYVRGVGNDYPYNKPIMVINKFDNDEVINFYIEDAGYFQNGTRASFKWAFNNEPGVIYKSSSFSISSDGNTVFFETFFELKSMTELSKLEFVNKLRLASKVSIRMSDRYGSNDVSFSLSGSTKAITNIIPLKIFTEITERSRKIKEEREAFVKIQELKFDTLLEYAKAVNIKKESLVTLKEEIKNELGIGSSNSKQPKKNIDSLDFKPGYSFDVNRWVDVFYVYDDGSRKESDAIYGVDSPSIMFKIREKEKIEFRKIQEKEKREEQARLDREKEALEKIEKEKERVKDILLKYKSEQIVDFIFLKIDYYKKIYEDFEYNEVEDIKTIFPRPIGGKISTSIELKIILKDGTVITKPIYPDFSITKAQLKEIGIRPLVEF